MMVMAHFRGFMMSFRLIEKDFKTLECIAEYRMLTRTMNPWVRCCLTNSVELEVQSV
jgi:hypothetical protein